MFFNERANSLLLLKYFNLIFTDLKRKRLLLTNIQPNLLSVLNQLILKIGKKNAGLYSFHSFLYIKDLLLVFA